jgi:hypothetical protein
MVPPPDQLVWQAGQQKAQPFVWLHFFSASVTAGAQEVKSPRYVLLDGK